MICIEKSTLTVSTLAIGLLLVGVHSNSHAFNVKAAYEKESHIQKEIADGIEELTKPIWEVNFERESIESIVYSQSGPHLRSDLIKSTDTEMNVSSGLIRLSLDSSFDPQARAYIQEIIEQYQGCLLYTSPSPRD